MRSSDSLGTLVVCPFSPILDSLSLSSSPQPQNHCTCLPLQAVTEESDSWGLEQGGRFLKGVVAELGL